MKVYFGRPFTNQNYKEVVEYYKTIEDYFAHTDVKPVIPLTGDESLKGDTIIKDNVDHFDNPILTERAIVKRDIWMLKNSDILVMDFSIEAKMPCGCFFELAWAYDWGLYTITVIPEGSKLDRIFVRQCSDVIFEDLGSAICYLKKL